MHGIRVSTKDTIAISPITTDEDKVVDIKVEISIKIENIKNVAVVVAIVTTIEAVADIAKKAENITIKSSRTIGVLVVLIDIIISQLEDIKKDTSKDIIKDFISRVLFYNKSYTILE